MEPKISIAFLTFALKNAGGYWGYTNYFNTSHLRLESNKIKCVDSRDTVKWWNFELNMDR
jgi:hypothetical protein